MTSGALLEELTSLAFTPRNRRLRELGQKSRTDRQIAQILDQWEQGDWQERYFCVQSCKGSHDAARLQRMSADPSRSVSSLATKLLTYLGTDEALIERLDKSNHRQRIRLLSQLKKLRRYSAADRFLNEAAAANWPRVAELIPYGSAQTVERHLLLGIQYGGLSFWKRLARQYPRIACQAMTDQINQCEEPDAFLLRQASAVVSHAARNAPDAVVSLVRLLSRFMAHEKLDLTEVLYHRPEAIAQILLESDQTQATGLPAVAAKITASTRLRLLREQPAALQIQAGWLKELTGPERSALFRETARAWRDAEGLTGVHLLGLLPSREREAEAERIADLPILTTRPQWQALYAGYLPWEKMRITANRFLSHPEGEMRGWGWQALLDCLRYHRARTAEVLAMIRKRPFEQDPVRLAILENLAALPPGIWTTADQAAIAGVIRDALDATDLSHASVASMIGWLQKLLLPFPHWAAVQLVIIYRERGKSWVAIPAIFQFLHRHRQDWLAPYLTRPRFTMRGGSITELITLLPGSGYEHYTQTQQMTLVLTLTQMRRLPKGKEVPWDVAIFLRAIDFLTKLPAYDGARLIELASDERPLIGEAALRALGRLDAGQGIPELLAALSDGRAGMAIYALRKIMVERPTTHMIAALQRAPMTKVTVAKEVVRLVAEFGGAEAFPWLMSLSRQELHCDLRIAVLRGLWDHLEQPDAWIPIGEAAQSTDGRLLGGVVRIPADCLSRSTRGKLIQLLARLARHGEATVRQSALQRFIEMPIADGEGVLIRAALASLTAASRDERELAARAIANNAVANDAVLIADTVASWREQRRFLHDFCATFTAEAIADAQLRRRLAPTALALVGALQSDPVTAALRVALAAAILGADPFEDQLRALAADLFPLGAIVREAEAGIFQLAQTKERSKLKAMESRMAAADEPHLRLLAFIALIVQAGDVDRWNEERRQRLATYRNDPSPIVAIRAQFYFLPDRDKE